MNKRKTRRIWGKWLIVVEIIALYFCVLNIISHARGALPYKIDVKNSLLQAADFQPFYDMGLSRTDDALPLLNGAEGGAAGYQANLNLNELEGIYISFQIDCPAEYAGGTLVIDLYNGETGYDYAEQEFQWQLIPEINEVSCQLTPGENHPENALLRFFTLDAADYTIGAVLVAKVVKVPPVALSMVLVTVFTALILIVTIVNLYVRGRKQDSHDILVQDHK